MKKFLPILLVSLVVLLTSSSVYAQEPAQKDMSKQKFEQRAQLANKQKEIARQKFEQRLQLTDKQKEKAKAIHQKGFEQMKPVITELDLKRKELYAIKKSDLSEEAKTEQMNAKKEEIKALDKKAREIRKQNSQEFEKILTKKQKKELEAMKAEGRAKFSEKHPPKQPLPVFNTHKFLTPQRLFPTTEMKK